MLHHEWSGLKWQASSYSGVEAGPTGQGSPSPLLPLWKEPFSEEKVGGIPKKKLSFPQPSTGKPRRQGEGEGKEEERRLVPSGSGNPKTPTAYPIACLHLVSLLSPTAALFLS